MLRLDGLSFGRHPVMQTISIPEDEVRRFLELLTVIGRRNSLRDPLASIAGEANLGAAQMHALMWLHRDAPLTMGALAQRLGVTDKTITGIVDRLERDGYVVRERSTGDRRVIQVVLAEPGRSLAQEIEKSVTHNMTQFLGLLDAQDRSDLFRILEHLVQKVEALAARGGPSQT